jgi:hypothetical protein
MVANFTCDVKRNLVNEAHTTELVPVTGSLMSALKSFSVASHFAALSAAREILAVYTLHCGLLNKKFTVHGLLTECTSTDFVGSFPNASDLF